MIRSRTNRRRGQATIELVFFLPMLVALLSIVFFAASLTLSRSHASIGARNKAFGGRHEPWKPSGDYTVSRLPVPGTSYAGLILGPRPRQRADGGLLRAEETRDVEVRFGPLKKLVQDVTTEHYVLGGSWDKQEIKFRHHPRLTLTEKSAYFGIGIPLNGFGNLIGFGSGGGGAGSAIASANQAISDARNQLDGVINDLRDQLNSVRNALNAERAKDPPDENRIRELEHRERELKQQIKEAGDAKDQIGLDLPTDVASPNRESPNRESPNRESKPSREKKKYNVYITDDRAAVGPMSGSHGRTYIEDPDTGKVHVYRHHSIGFSWSFGGGIAYSEQAGTIELPVDFDPRELTARPSYSANGSVAVGVGGTTSVDSNGNQIGGFQAGAIIEAGAGATETTLVYLGTANSLEESGLSQWTLK
jgi:hypothetical protein